MGSLSHRLGPPTSGRRHTGGNKYNVHKQTVSFTRLLRTLFERGGPAAAEQLPALGVRHLQHGRVGVRHVVRQHEACDTARRRCMYRMEQIRSAHTQTFAMHMRKISRRQLMVDMKPLINKTIRSQNRQIGSTVIALCMKRTVMMSGQAQAAAHTQATQVMPNLRPYAHGSSNDSGDH